MKSTGIVRRIDELGRLVIPKEIRKILRIREGENLEIFLNNENIILKKFSFMNKIEEHAQNFTDSIYELVKYNILITDTDNIIAFSGPLKKQYINKKISEQLITFIKRRDSIHEKYKKKLKLIDDKEIECTYVLNSIITNGDVAGLVIIFSEDERVSEIEMRICNIAANFLAKSIE